jgi:hypothetical protein
MIKSIFRGERRDEWPWIACLVDTLESNARKEPTFTLTASRSQDSTLRMRTINLGRTPLRFSLVTRRDYSMDNNDEEQRLLINKEKIVNVEHFLLLLPLLYLYLYFSFFLSLVLLSWGFTVLTLLLELYYWAEVHMLDDWMLEKHFSLVHFDHSL